MHKPVLLNQIVENFSYLSKIERPVFVDGTVGAAGHSLVIAKKPKTKNQKLKFMAIDRDETALEIARTNIKAAGFEGTFILIHNNFKNIDDILISENIEKIDGALLDLGVSSMQLDDKSRGFSFQNSEQKLDMRMDQSQTFSATDVVNDFPESELMKIIFEFGEERFARQIARRIVEQRKNKKIETVGELVETIAKAIPGKLQHQGVHFATRTFQAIRIVVNAELSGLEECIDKYVDHLNSDGRLAIISFHSLEDRLVKKTFRKLENPCECPAELPCVCGKKPVVKILTKKPIIADESEIRDNPRSRSAKLRIVAKL